MAHERNIILDGGNCATETTALCHYYFIELAFLHEDSSKQSHCYGETWTILKAYNDDMVTICTPGRMIFLDDYIRSRYDSGHRR